MSGISTYNETGDLVETNIFRRDPSTTFSFFSTRIYQYNENRYLVNARTLYTDPLALNSETKYSTTIMAH